MSLSKTWDDNWAKIDNIDKYIQVENSDFLWVKMHHDKVDQYLSALKKDSLFLEAGCGLGQWCFYANRKYNLKALGVDIAEETIVRLKKYVLKNKLEGIDFQIDDLNKTRLKEQMFDMFLSLGVIEHFKDSNQMLGNLYKILKPNGVGLITVPNIYSFHTLTRPISKLLGKWECGYEKSFSPRGLRKICQDNGFKILESGILINGLFFGQTLADMFPFIRKLSCAIEKKTNMLGFIMYIVVSK